MHTRISLVTGLLASLALFRPRIVATPPSPER
jgi:hypothetical protein